MLVEYCVVSESEWHQGSLYLGACLEAATTSAQWRVHDTYCATHVNVLAGVCDSRKGLGLPVIFCSSIVVSHNLCTLLLSY